MAAIFYDSLLLLAACFLATALALPLNHGEAFSSDQYAYPVYLLSVCFVYFGWFWSHGGQTPGMKAWKLQVVPEHYPDHVGLGWKQASVRFLTALLSWGLFGLGFVLMLFDADNRALHDRMSGSRIVFRLSNPA